MPVEFLSLADRLRPRPRCAQTEPQPVDDEKPSLVTAVVMNDEKAVESHPSASDDAVRDAIAQAKRFRAALADALADVRARVLRDLASEVLARELALAPCDLDRIVARAIEEHGAHDAVRVRVSHHERLARCPLPVVVDATLEAGDAILECRSGSIDLRLGVRLADVLAQTEHVG